MDHLHKQEGAPSAMNPPPDSEKQPYDQQPPPAHGLANPAMPTQYQTYYTPYSAVPSSGPVVQPQQHTTVIVPAQTINASDYLAYSIFTMLCCCLPVGIAALVYSIRTQDANRMGNGAEAQRNSRMAWILANTALGLGILLALGVTVMMVVSNK